MALWLIRTGKHGEHESKFFGDGRIYLTWGGIGGQDLSKIPDKQGLGVLVQNTYPTHTKGHIGTSRGQIWAFVNKLKPGDLVISPRKEKSALAVGEITGPYEYDQKAQSPNNHSRAVKWFSTNISRSAFEQDLLYSFGSLLTICQIKRNNAEARVKAMSANNWKPKAVSVTPDTTDDAEDSGESVDLEQLGQDAIASLIIRKFKGHGLARLVEAVLRAQGYTTYRSPEGPDKGIDLLAAPGALGFGSPRICVQVKSSDGAVDRPTLDQLIGTMSNVKAEQGLLVSWGGFKSSVEKETAQQFFHVRLWDRADIIEQILANYDKLDEELRAEIPLKRIWTVAAQEEDE